MSKLLLREIAEHYLISEEYFMKRDNGKWLLPAKVREDEEDYILHATCAYIEALTLPDVRRVLSADPKWDVRKSLEFANIDMSQYAYYRRWWKIIETFVHNRRKLDRAVKEFKRKL